MDNALNRLRILYDDVIKLAENRYYASSIDYSTILDGEGNTCFEFIKPLSTFERCGYGWIYSYFGDMLNLIYIEDNGEIVQTDLKVVEFKHLTNYLCCLICQDGYKYSIYGNKFKRLTPSVYEQVYLNKETLHKTLLNVRINQWEMKYESNRPTELYTVASVDKLGNKMDYMYTAGIGAQNEYTALAVMKDESKVDKRHLVIDFRYKLARYGDILNNESFTSITCSNRSIDRGLLEVWEEKNRYNYKGLMGVDGTLLIKPDRYGNIEETPFKDLFIVHKAKSKVDNYTKVKSDIGIYQLENGEVIPCGTFERVRLTKFNIIEFTHKLTGKQLYFGNDRNIYPELKDAFEIKQLYYGGDRLNIFKINVYGEWYIADAQLNETEEHLKYTGITNQNWIKIK